MSKSLKSEIKSRAKNRFTGEINNSNFFHYLHDDENFQLENYLGISLDEYPDYIIDTFSNEINDETGFAIDHIKPISRALTEDEYKSYWHYTNTKAESKFINTLKSNYYDYQFYFSSLNFTKKSAIYNSATSKFKDFLHTMILGIPIRIEPLVKINLASEKTIKKSRESYKLKYEELEKSEKLVGWECPPERWFCIEELNEQYEINWNDTKPSMFRFINSLKENPKKYIEFRNKFLDKDVVPESRFLSLQKEWDMFKREKKVIGSHITLYLKNLRVSGL